MQSTDNTKCWWVCRTRLFIDGNKFRTVTVEDVSIVVLEMTSDDMLVVYPNQLKFLTAQNLCLLRKQTEFAKWNKPASIFLKKYIYYFIWKSELLRDRERKIFSIFWHTPQVAKMACAWQVGIWESRVSLGSPIWVQGP